MGVRWRRACLAGIGAIGVVMGSSCQEHTAIVIDVRAVGLAASDLNGVTFSVGAPGATEDAQPTTATNAATSDDTGTFVGTLVAVPASSDDATVSIRVVAGIGRVRAEQCTARNG